MELFRHKKKRSGKWGRKLDLGSGLGMVAGLVLFLVLGKILPHRMTVLTCMVGGIAAVVALILTICLSRKGKELLRVPSWVGGFAVMCGFMSFVGFVTTLKAYSFYKEPSTPFWEICLALGLAVGVFVTVKWVWKGTGWGGRIGSLVFCTVLAFLLSWMTLCHMNYLLDFEPPAERQAVIEEKQVHRNAKSPDSYEFELTVGGESFDLKVGRREYDRYEVGDTYTFKAYKGAFGKPFCVAGD